MEGICCNLSEFEDPIKCVPGDNEENHGETQVGIVSLHTKNRTWGELISSCQPLFSDDDNYIKDNYDNFNNDNNNNKTTITLATESFA